jgi:hypothetical protein
VALNRDRVLSNFEHDVQPRQEFCEVVGQAHGFLRVGGTQAMKVATAKSSSAVIRAKFIFDSVSFDSRFSFALTGKFQNYFEEKKFTFEIRLVCSWPASPSRTAAQMKSHRLPRQGELFAHRDRDCLRHEAIDRALAECSLANADCMWPIESCLLTLRTEVKAHAVARNILEDRCAVNRESVPQRCEYCARAEFLVDRDKFVVTEH